MNPLVLRTPEHCFDNLPDFPWAPNYLTVQHPEHGPLRLHYLDVGPVDGQVVLMLHGEPTWCFLYRHMIHALSRQGLRCIAPDLIGFGRSDKLARRGDYSYAAHVGWVTDLVDGLDLRNITLVCQDWGGPIGLSVLAHDPARFAAVVAANTLLPNCEAPPRGVPDWPGDIVTQWVAATASAEDLPVGDTVAAVCVNPLPDAVHGAYDVPFPEPRYKAGPLEFPSLIPIREDMPGTTENRATWRVLETWEKPFVTAFSDSDPSTAAWAEVFCRRVPGARGQAHPVIAGAGHFLQEEQGPVLAEVVAQLVRQLH